MSYFSATGVKGSKSNCRVQYSNPTVFIEKLNALELKLDRIKNKTADNFLNFTKSSIKDWMLCLFDLFRVQPCFNINTLVDMQDKPKEDTFASKRDTIKHAIHSLKKYLNKRKLTDKKMQDHTDILNIYWYSKAEVEMIEEINSCLEQYGSIIKTLEI